MLIFLLNNYFKQVFFFFILIGLITSSCANKNHNSRSNGGRNSIKVTKLKEIALPLPDSNYIFINGMHYENQDRDYFFAVFAESNNATTAKLVWYDLSTSKYIKNISLPAHLTNQKASGTHIFREDSVLIFFPAGYRFDMEEDSSLILFDAEAGIRKVYDWGKYPRLRFHSNPIKDNIYGTGGFRSEGILITEGRVIVPTFEWRDFGKFTGHVGTMGFLFDLKTEKYITIPVNYPDENYKYFWTDKYLHSSAAISLTKNPIFYLKYSPYLYEYDLKKQKNISHFSPSALFDSIVPLPLNQSQNPSAWDKFNRENGSYYNLLTDFKNNRYIRFLELPIDTTLSLKEQNEVHYGIAILNQNFEVVAEDKIEVALNPSGYFTKKGYWCYNKEKSSMSKSNIYFQEWDISATTKEVKRKEKEPINTKNENMDNFIQHYPSLSHNNDTSMLLAIPIDQSCLPCLKGVLYYLKEWSSSPKINNLHIILYASYSVNEKDFLDYTNQLKFFPKSNLYIDEKGDYLAHAYRHINPKLYIISKSKIIKTFQDSPANQREFMLTIAHYLGIKNPIIK